MSFQGVTLKPGMYLPVLLIIASLFLSGTALAGEIKPPLDELIDKAETGEMIKVIAVLKDKIDNQELDNRLKARKANLQQRHFEVISSLQEKATITQSPALDLLSELENRGQVKDIKNFWITNAIAFRGTKEAIERVANHEDIALVSFDMPVELIEPVKSSNHSEPLTASHSQGLDVMNAPAVWAMGYTGAGRLVSNIDTGVDGSHPALSPSWRGNNGHPASECWYDPVNGTTTPTDDGSHGTHTMGTICGRSNTTYDTVGVAIDAQWISVSVIDVSGSTTSDVIDCFEFIADPDGNPATMDDVPDVASNSWGWSPLFHGVPACDTTFWDVMDATENAGVVVVFAAGNEGDYGSSSLRTPSDRATTAYNAFSVGAIDGHTAGYPIAYFSSLGPSTCASGDLNIKPEVVAPGVDIYSSIPGGGYSGDWSGTSMACPHIAGAVAIIRQVNPGLTVDQVKEIIIQSCVDLGSPGQDNTFGNGYLDLLTAVQLAGTGFGWIEGYVRDDVYNNPLPATVSLEGTSISTVCNAQGYFMLGAAPDTTYTVVASYSGYGQDDAQVYVILDDTVSQNFFLSPPLIDYSPVSFNVSVPPGETTDRDLTITNTGSGTLNYSLATEIYDFVNRETGESVPVALSAPQPEPLGYRMSDSDKPGAGMEPYYPPVVTGQGGPDTYGYTWIDSDEAGGPPATWIDISGSGNTVDLDDDDTVNVSIGFSFPFYENTYTSLYICSNGFVIFGTPDVEFDNEAIPNTGTPNNMIAALWDDLAPHRGIGSVMHYYDSANNRFIVSWIGIPFYYSTGAVNAQIVIYPNGIIECNYQTLDGGTHGLDEATIGLENSSGTDGLQVCFNQSYIHSNMSILFSSGYWLSVDPASGSVNSGYSDIVDVIFDATELEEGTYDGNINLYNNSANNDDIDIPVTLHVSDTPTPLIELSVSAIYDTVYAGYSTNYELVITNSGDTTLTYSISDNRAWIDESPSGGDIPAGDNDPITISFDAGSLSPGNLTGTVTVNSNDPENATINVPVYLFVDLLVTTDVGVTDIFEPADSLVTESEFPIKVEVTNFGSDPQTFDVVFEAYYLDAPAPLYTTSMTISNMPDSSTGEYTFPNGFTPDIDTTYTFIAYTDLAGDQVPGNDSFEKSARAYNFVSIWYGNLDLSPVEAPVGEMGMVDVYIRTPANAYVADMHLCLGSDDSYIVSSVSDSNGAVYYPLTEWSSAFFIGPYGSPPNDEGWSSESLIGFSRLSRTLDDNPWLYSETPLKIASFAKVYINDDGYVGEAFPALGPGINPVQGPTNVGDTLGGLGYSAIEMFSEIVFTEPASGCDYMPGDVNGDKTIIGSDVTYAVNYFRSIGDPPPDSCWNESTDDWLYSAADCNGDCLFIGADVTYLVNYFRGFNQMLYCPDTPPLDPGLVAGSQPGKYPANRK